MNKTTPLPVQRADAAGRIAYPLSVVPATTTSAATPEAAPLCRPRVDLRTGQTLAPREIATPAATGSSTPVPAAIRLETALVAALPDDPAARFAVMRQIELGRSVGVPCIGSVSTLAELQALMELGCELADGPLLDDSLAGPEGGDPASLHDRNARLVALAAACITR
jgi:hypothetical protein